MQAPQNIQVKATDKIMLLQFDEQWLQVPFEILRVYSPSAEVKGHGGTGGTLPTGKRLIGIEKIEPVGNYAIRIFFDDGHDSGLFSWQYLHDLASQEEQLMAQYQAKLDDIGASREPMFINLTNL